MGEEGELVAGGEVGVLDVKVPEDDLDEEDEGAEGQSDCEGVARSAAGERRGGRCWGHPETASCQGIASTEPFALADCSILSRLGNVIRHEFADGYQRRFEWDDNSFGVQVGTVNICMSPWVLGRES
jgi:hypothetical protein